MNDSIPSSSLGIKRYWSGTTAFFSLLFLVLPFIALILSTSWKQFHLYHSDWMAINQSLIYTLIALVVIVIFGLPLSWWLARQKFTGKWLIEILVLLPLLTPPLAMGILLASLYGPYGIIGHTVSQWDWRLTNTPAAFVLAQIYAAAPYFILTARSAFEAVPKDYEQAAYALGKNDIWIFWRISLPLSRLGIATGLAIAWIRALGEFGVVLIMAYFPQGIPVKLWVNLQDSGLNAVYPLLWVFFAVALPLPLLLGTLTRFRPVVS